MDGSRVWKEKVADSKISGYAAKFAGCVWMAAVSGKKKLRIKKYPDTLPNSPDACGWKPCLERKSCGLKNIRIRCQIRRMRVDGSRLWKEKVADSKISGYVWTVRKNCGLKNIRIRCQIRGMRVDGSRVWKEKVADTC